MTNIGQPDRDQPIVEFGSYDLSVIVYEIGKDIANGSRHLQRSQFRPGNVPTGYEHGLDCRPDRANTDNRQIELAIIFKSIADIAVPHQQFARPLVIDDSWRMQQDGLHMKLLRKATCDFVAIKRHRQPFVTAGDLHHLLVREI